MPLPIAAMPTGDHNPNGHTTTEVYNALVGRLGSRRWSYRYELLTNTHARIMDLEEVLECTVEWQYLADIKRQATMTIRDLGRVNYLSDRLRPWVRLHLSPFGEKDWVEWPMGMFLLNSPTRHAGEYDTIDRAITAFDPTWAMEDDKVTSRAPVAAGSNLVSSAIAQVTAAGAVPNSPEWILATRSTETLPATREWPPGTSRRQICNDLLAMAEFESISFDGLGRAVLQPYVDPNTRPVTWTYTYGQEGLVIPDVDQELDLFNIPNKVLIVVSEPDQAMVVASATNTNPASPTSTVRRGRTIVDFRDAEEAASQTVLNARALRILREHAQVYEHLVFSTGAMPFHGFNDVLSINYDPLAINTKYHETSWTLEMKHDGKMRHEARRLVNV